MALDTQEKRMNVMGVGRPWMRVHFSGTIDEQWRIAVGNAYGGNALTAAAGWPFYPYPLHDLVGGIPE